METYSYNNLQNNGFTFALERIPQTMFRVTECDVPSIQVPPPSAGFPGATQYFPGMSTEFDELQLQFIVDEDLKNYEELYRWITQQRFATDIVPTTSKEEKLVSDGVLVTLNNASKPTRTFYFKDLFPIFLGNIHFDTTVDQPQPVTCAVTFRYSYFILGNA